MEEVAGLEPTHTGFAIPGITNFAIPPQEQLKAIKTTYFEIIFILVNGILVKIK